MDTHRRGRTRLAAAAQPPSQRPWLPSVTQRRCLQQDHKQTQAIESENQLLKSPPVLISTIKRNSSREDNESYQVNKAYF